MACARQTQVAAEVHRDCPTAGDDGRLAGGLQASGRPPYARRRQVLREHFQCSYAAKYRKLALKYREDVVCCAILKRDESDLLERLEVATVPSVQIFDGERATRLGECACEVGMFVDVEKKVLSAIMAMKKKRSFLRRLVDQRPNLMRLASSLGDEPTIKMKRTSAR